MITMPNFQFRFCLKPLSIAMLSIGLTACTGPTSPVNNLKPVTKDASLKPSDQSGESSTLNDSAERQVNLLFIKFLLACLETRIQITSLGAQLSTMG